MKWEFGPSEEVETVYLADGSNHAPKRLSQADFNRKAMRQNEVFEGLARSFLTGTAYAESIPTSLKQFGEQTKDLDTERDYDRLNLAVINWGPLDQDSCLGGDPNLSVER